MGWRASSARASCTSGVCPPGLAAGLPALSLSLGTLLCTLVVYPIAQATSPPHDGNSGSRAATALTRPLPPPPSPSVPKPIPYPHGTRTPAQIAPGPDHGVVESLPNTLLQIEHSPAIQQMALGFCVLVFILNSFSVLVPLLPPSLPAVNSVSSHLQL